MKKAKKEMIRNLLYSLCLHVLFLLILFFNDAINSVINKEITHINIINIDKSLFANNEIKTTETDLFPELSLQDKIDLYKISKSIKNENKVLPPLQEDINNINTNLDINAVKKIINANNNYNNKNNEYVLYLGPTDYKRYVKKQEEKMKMVEVVKQNNINKNISTNAEKDRLENIVADINKNNINKTNNNTINNVNKNEQNIQDLDKILSKITNNNNTNNKNNINKKVVMSGNEQIITKNNNEHNKNLLLNIDVDKIFTQKDLKQIKEIIKRENSGFGLSARERMVVQNQLVSCYKNALIQTGKKSMVKTSVTIKLFMDGIIDSKEIKIKVIDDENKFSPEDYDVAINNARVALAYCNPIRNLPSTKYQSWQNINFIFDETK